MKKEVETVSGLILKTDESCRKIKAELKTLIESIDGGVDVEEIDKIEDVIYKVKDEKEVIERRIVIEDKIDALQKTFNTKNTELRLMRNKVRALESSLEEDMYEKVGSFSQIYNDFMRRTMQGCRDARISLDDYMPVINNGEYIEASAYVYVKFLYYLTLLEMSLQRLEIPFPRFLLVDTPDTAGIDNNKYIPLLSEMKNLEFKQGGQVILTTGLNTYPSELSKCVCLSLNKENGDFLLKANK